MYNYEQTIAVFVILLRPRKSLGYEGPFADPQKFQRDFYAVFCRSSGEICSKEFGSHLHVIICIFTEVCRAVEDR